MRNSVYPGSHHRSTSRNVTTYSMDELTRSSELSSAVAETELVNHRGT